MWEVWKAMENQGCRIGDGALGTPTCSLAVAVLHVLRAVNVTIVVLSVHQTTACSSYSLPCHGGSGWKEQVGTGQGEQPAQELPSPPPAASSGASQTTLGFYALPEVFPELTAVMLTVTICCRKYGGRVQMHQGRARGLETGNQPDAGPLGLCSSWSQDGWQHEQSIDCQDAPLASEPRDLTGLGHIDMIDG